MKRIKTSIQVESAFLISHYKRQSTWFPDFTVYHDEINGHNEDPYVWNKNFLWTFCNRRPYDNYKRNDLIFWVNQDNDSLFCDCIFYIQTKHQWEHVNQINTDDPMIDSDCAFQNHYRHVRDHKWSGKTPRFTFKAHPELSFLAHDSSRNLIDISSFLNQRQVKVNFKKGNCPYNWPVTIPNNIAIDLYIFLAYSDVIIKGSQIEKLHPNCQTTNYDSL